MANVINATSTGNGGLITTGDDSGILNIQTNETTAVSVDASQNLTFTNAINAPNTFGFKNRIINGAMMIDQRNAGASVTPTTNGTYVLDRWQFGLNNASKYSVQQSSTAPAGFSNSILVTSLAATSVAAGDYYSLLQPIEGFNTADFNFGTANAATITVSFWVRCSLTGTFGGWVQNANVDRSYPFSYTISAANTWEKKTITIAGDTTGTWVGATNGVGLYLGLSLGMGSTRQGTANTWAAANYRSVTGETPLVGTNGATFYITGVQFEFGTQATSFDFRDYGRELIMCQRYYEKSYNIDVAPGTATSNGAIDVTVSSNGSALATYQVKFAVTKRSAPSLTGYRTNGTSGQWTYERSGVAGTGQTVSFGGISTDTAYSAVNVGANWTVCEIYGFWTASAEL